MAGIGPATRDMNNLKAIKFTYITSGRKIARKITKILWLKMFYGL